MPVVDDAEARAVLGVGPQAAAAEIRVAFRRRVRRAHPDVAPARPEAGRDTTRLVQAYAVLRRSAAAGPPGPVAAPSTGPGASPNAASPTQSPVALGTDRLVYATPRRELYLRLVDAVDQIGEITYVDPDGRLLDTVVTMSDGVACSLLASLRQSLSGTEIYFTLEPLGAEARPSIGPVVAAVASLLGTP